jgi:hypothetical protein
VASPRMDLLAKRNGLAAASMGGPAPASTGAARAAPKTGSIRPRSRRGRLPELRAGPQEARHVHHPLRWRHREEFDWFRAGPRARRSLNPLLSVSAAPASASAVPLAKRVVNLPFLAVRSSGTPASWRAIAGWHAACNPWPPPSHSRGMRGPQFSGRVAGSVRAHRQG